MKLALVTNMPAPYRLPAWNEVAAELGENFLVLFCCHREPNREWDLPPISFRHQYLKENYRVKKDGSTYIHNNRDVWKQLKDFDPDILITGGFNPTMLYAFLYARLHGKKHIPISDAWEMSEGHLSVAHRALRKLVFRQSDAFIACSVKGKNYFKKFGIGEEAIFISHYAISNAIPPTKKSFDERDYDLMFSGQFTKRKNPVFFVTIARQLKKYRKDLKLLILGDGPLREDVIRALDHSGIQYHYPGYARQQALPAYYSSCKLLLFPTEYDAWGVVANESMQQGTPVLVTPYAGCSGELVKPEENGFVLPLEEGLWTEKCLELLQDKDRWDLFSENARRAAADITHKKSAEAVLQACYHAFHRRKRK